MKAAPQPSLFQRMGKPCLAGCLTVGVHRTHADDGVIVEGEFGGTQRGVWAGVEPTGKQVQGECVLIFIFEGSDLVCEKVYFDNATILRQMGALV